MSDYEEDQPPVAQPATAKIPVTVRLPPFNLRDVPLWFAQVESAFDLSCVTDSHTQFKVVTGALSPEVASEIRTTILNPPATDQYLTLKKALQDRYGLSSGQRVSKLLSTEELGDRKPSAFLSSMLALVDDPDKLDPTFLKTLFLQRLPTSVQTILALAVDDVSLEILALQADKIMEVGSRTDYAIASVGTRAPTATTVNAYHEAPKPQPAAPVGPSELSVLTAVLEKLQTNIADMAKRHDEFDKLVKRRDEGRSSERGERSRSRNRSQSRPRDNSKFDTCWYHYKFGAKATKCDLPCAWNSNSGNARPES